MTKHNPVENAIAMIAGLVTGVLLVLIFWTLVLSAMPTPPP
jgi:uncharacterized membrane protein YccC